MGATELNAGPPDFVGVGAQRSGTTWWFRVLLQHPQIKRPAPRKKELHFFDKFCARAMGDGDVDRYHTLFPRRGRKITGEWTPRYMHDPWTPRLLARAAPDAKLLVLLRDPVERYRSGVLHEARARPGRKPASTAVDQFSRGFYAAQLRRLWAHFDREQVLVLQYERCREDAPGQYARTLRFLGVRDDFVPQEFTRVRGRSYESQKEPLWPDLEEELTAALEPDVRDLRDLLPDFDLALWPHFAHLAALRA